MKVEVVEGFIDKVTVSGCPGRSKPMLEDYSQHILQSKPLKIQVLEHEMLLMNDIPGLDVKAVITPSKTTPAAANLELVTHHKYATGYASYDNYGTRFIGPIETSLAGSLNSVLIPNDSTNVHFTVTSKESELQFYDFSHTQYVGSHGLNFSIGTNYTQTQPQFLLKEFDVIGRSNSFYGNVYYPVIRTRTKNLYAHAIANYQNVTSQILETPFYQDRIRSLTLGGNFDGTDSYGGYNTAGLDVVQGFEFFGADMHALQSRPRGRAKYTRAVGSASRLQHIYGRYSFYLSGSSQFSCNPLLATEQFSYGGPIYGRGYGPSEIVGDRGVAAKAELRADIYPEKSYLQSIEFYLFYDGGVVWNLDTLNLPAKQSATSSGFGARFSFIPQLFGEAYIAKPLTRQAFTLTPLDQNPQQARAFFQIVAQFS